jgi:N4-gp56 family major capsid protein
MATTAFPTNHPLAVKVWSKKLFVEALKETYFSRFMGEGSDSLIQMKGELNKSAGDKITYGLRMQLSGDGVQGDASQEGNEEALTTYSDSVLVDQIRHAVRSAGKMSEQRVPFSVREEARSGLQDWWSNKLDTAFFNHLCNDVTQTNTLFTGNNAIAALDTTHRMVAHLADQSAGGSEASISTTDIFNLTFIDRAVEKAKTISPMIRPIKMGGDDFYVTFLHPYQVYNLRTTSSAGQWLDIQKAALSSGQRFAENPIWTGALGVYNNVILHESTRVTPAINAGAYVANTRRAVLCGAQAAVFAYGQPSSGGEMSWVEELFDYKNQLGVAAGMIFGIKATRFNNLDFARLLIPTYAAPHA